MPCLEAGFRFDLTPGTGSDFREKKKPYPDQTFEKKPDPDPNFAREKKLDPSKAPGS